LFIIVVFASAKMVVGAFISNSNPYFIRYLLFRGAFPYPVVEYFSTIFMKL